MRKIKIGDRWIGEGEPCFIIAEAGSNHNGSLEQAFRLVDAAVEAKADAVKFQTFRARGMYPKTGGSVEYLKSLGLDRPIYDIIRDMEMPFEWIPKLAGYCSKKKIIFLSTPFDEECTNQLDPYVPAYKIASYELTHIPLIQHVAEKGKPLIVSTGAATFEEIQETMQAIKDVSSVPVALMQCTAKYPAPLDALNLRTIPLMRKEFDVPVGFSDHSREPWTAPLVAFGLGINILEKHYTLSNSLPGPDHSFAIEAHELKELVHQIRLAEKTLGDGKKVPLEDEKELRNYQRGIFTTRAVGVGETLNESNVAVLRRAGKSPSDLSPKFWNRVLGQKAKRALTPYTLISSEDVTVESN